MAQLIVTGVWSSEIYKKFVNIRTLVAKAIASSNGPLLACRHNRFFKIAEGGETPAGGRKWAAGGGRGGLASPSAAGF